MTTTLDAFAAHVDPLANERALSAPKPEAKLRARVLCKGCFGKSALYIPDSQGWLLKTDDAPLQCAFRLHLIAGAGSFPREQFIPDMNGQDQESRGKTVVTGATGFVGSYLYNDLVRRKLHPQSFSFSAMLSGAETPFPKEADTCVHLAARVHVMKETAADALAEYRRINTDGTISLARLAAAAGCRRFVFISSIKVNGEETPAGKMFSAGDEPKPEDPYGVSKYEAEAGLKKLAAETGMDLVIIRPPLVYGPGVRANFLAMMKLLDRRLPLPFGLVNNRRSLVSLANLSDFIITCLDHPSAANQVFLVSDGEDLSTMDLLVRLGRAMGKPARLLPVPQPLLTFSAGLLGKGAVAKRVLGSLALDIVKSRETLGWRPPLAVDEALRQVSDWYRQVR